MSKRTNRDDVAGWSSRGAMFVGLILAAGLTALGGCGPSHQHVEVAEVGWPLHLQVRLPEDQAADAAGTLYYRMPMAERFDYAAEALEKRGLVLAAALPTQDLDAGEAVAYYFEVTAGGEATNLGSPGSPYVTRFLSPCDMVARELRFGVESSRGREPVRFWLDPGGYGVDWAAVTYTPAGFGGFVQQEMVRGEGGRWVADVDGRSVRAGLWTYRIDLEVEGEAFSDPEHDGVIEFRVERGERRERQEAARAAEREQAERAIAEQAEAERTRAERVRALRKALEQAQEREFERELEGE
ncbi:MAG: hypothetical protein AAGE65_14680 [Planctomycetota bacterium]